MPTSRVCYSCQVFAHQTDDGSIRILRVSSASEHGFMYRMWRPFTCDNCGAPSVGTVHAFERGPMNGTRAEDLFRVDGDVRFQPEHPVGKEFPDVPDDIAQAADEAHRCNSIQAFRGATILGRAVIEATAKDNGIAAGNLYAKIEAMAARGLIRDHIKEAAHVIRDFGNDMAHGDFSDKIHAEDAKLILELMGEILSEVYQSPARVARIQAERQARKAAGPTSIGTQPTNIQAQTAPAAPTASESSPSGP